MASITLYKEQIQGQLTRFDKEYPILEKELNTMGVAITQWNERVQVLSAAGSALTDSLKEEKKTEFDKFLGFQKIHNTATEIISELNKVLNACTRSKISTEVYDTLNGLGYDVKLIQSDETKLVEDCQKVKESRVKLELLVKKIEGQLVVAKLSLENLMAYKENSLGLVNLFFGSKTPFLDKALDSHKKEILALEAAKKAEESAQAENLAKAEEGKAADKAEEKKPAPSQNAPYPVATATTSKPALSSQKK